MRQVHMITITTIYTFIYISITFPVPSWSVNADFHPAERDALVKLRDSLSSDLVRLHARWTGPPCHGNDTNWLGVVCSETGHVIALVLENLALNGSISSTPFLDLTHLVNLSLSNNSISGQLPEFSGLTRLRSVSLNDNRFSGGVPASLAGIPRLDLARNSLRGEIPPAMRRFPRSCFEGNLGLCGPPLEDTCPAPAPEKGRRRREGLRWWGVAAIATAVGFVSFGVLILWVFRYNGLKLKLKVVVVLGKDVKEDDVNEIFYAECPMKRGSPKSKRDPERGVNLEFFDKEMPSFDFDDLLRSSAEVLGKGTLGTTYKTTLETGHHLAVKRLNDMSDVTKRDFARQMKLLGRISDNEYLVKIVSFYFSKEEKLVVNEFVPGESLFDLLHENRGRGRVPLNWEIRVSIIKDIAKGLTFLHQSLPRHKVPHANLKSTNILIQRIDDDRNLHSKITDFGYFPLVNSSRQLAFTRSPEHVDGKKLSRKTDVYCFGIVMLEIITGRIPGETSPGSEDKEEDLSDWVRKVVNNDWSTDILDAEIIAASEGHDEMLMLTDVALQCTDIDAKNRPKMSEVLRNIEEIEMNRNENDL